MIKFGILVGVSSDPQAHEEKASIPDQIETCRRVIEQLGGEEAGCYQMDGYSRTGYDSLSDAMQDIPPLKEAIEAAAQDLYDVLLLDNWDRLGDLGQLVSTRFKKYRKQIYSARQSGRLHDPATYDPYNDESADIDMHVQGILQKYRINKLRRGWSAGMPKRIEKGLNPLRVPFAYIWVGRKDPPKLDPVRGTLLQQLKDLFLAGRSYHSLALFADQSGIRPPNGGEHWDQSAIQYMIGNPFYAGVVELNRTKYIYDPNRAHKRRPVEQPRSRWMTGKGIHQPLWDEATYRAICKELERRQERDKRFSARFPFSGLLKCSVCLRKLHRRSHGHANYGRRKVFSCEAGPSHVIIPYDECVDLVARELMEQFATHWTSAGEPAQETDQTQASIEEFKRQRQRVQSGHKLGLYTDAEAQEEIGKIHRQIETIEQRTHQAHAAAELRQEFVQYMGDDLSELPRWIKSDEDPQLVNRLLSSLCEEILISPERDVVIHWR